jgi:hypothetical protein
MDGFLPKSLSKKGNNRINNQFLSYPDSIRYIVLSSKLGSIKITLGYNQILSLLSANPANIEFLSFHRKLPILVP